MGSPLSTLPSLSLEGPGETHGFLDWVFISLNFFLLANLFKLLPGAAASSLWKGEPDRVALGFGSIQQPRGVMFFSIVTQGLAFEFYFLLVSLASEVIISRARYDKRK